MIKETSKLKYSAAAMLLAGGCLAAVSASAQVSVITVTTERREANLQDVPVAVTALGELQIQQRMILDTHDLIRQVPNLIGNRNVGQNNNITYFMRGVGNDESLLSFDPPIQTYVDDVVFPRQLNNNVSFLDIERVEVLRGPQGTLYGRNATAGAVKVFTKKPSDEFYGRMSVRYGNKNEVNLFATANAPVRDNLFLKATGFFERDDGHQENISVPGAVSHQKGKQGLMLQGRLLASDSLTLDLSFDFTESDNIGPIGSSSGAEDLFSYTTPGQEDPDFGTWGKDYGFNLTARWDGSPVAVESITSYRHTKMELLGEFYDPGALLAAGFFPEGGFLIDQESEVNVFTQEVKGTADFEIVDRNMSWVGGIFYINESNNQRILDFNGFVDSTMPPVNTADRKLDWDINSVAFYSQLDYEVVPDVNLIFGGRVTYEQKQTEIDYQIGTGPLLTADLIAMGVPVELETWEFDPKVGIQWQATDDINFYVTYTNGHKSPGWNNRIDIASDFFDFRQENVNSYEAGMRSEWFDNQVRLNLTGFRTTYKDLVTTATQAGLAGGGSVFGQFNAGDSRVSGIEGELFVSMIEGLDLFASAGYQKGGFTELRPQLTIGNPNLKQFPQWTAHWGFNYRRPVNDLFDAFLSADASYHADYYAAQGNANDVIQNKVLTNAQAGIELADGRWRIAMECSNCTNEKAYDAILFGRFYPTDPLRFGGRITARLN